MPIDKKDFEKLFPHDGLVYFDPAFNRIKEVRKKIAADRLKDWQKRRKQLYPELRDGKIPPLSD